MSMKESESDSGKMRLCEKCYETLKIVPNIVRLGRGIACWGGTTCDECGDKIRVFISIEISNKNIEIYKNDTIISNDAVHLK